MSLTNFPEMWQNRVEVNINKATVATFVDGIAELDTNIVEMGSGTASESNVIHIPTSDFEPDVLINNTTYPLAVQSYTDSEVLIALDKFQTKATELTDDQIMGASYPRIDAATASHPRAITAKKYTKAAHAMAPATNTVATPVITTTGDGTEASGQRLRLTYDDLVNLKAACDGATPPMPDDSRRLVLCNDHWNDLLHDRKLFADQFVSYKAGNVVNICGFEIHKFSANPVYNASAKTKLAFGATPAAGQYQASFVFDTSNVAKKTGLTKQYFKLASTDPENQSNKLNYRHYFIMCPKRVQKIAAICSINKA